jgi:membrane-associated protease RseP (regulator of RpoE activity)
MSRFPSTVTAALLLLACGPVVSAADEDYRAGSELNQRPMLGVEMSPVETRLQDREGIDAHTGVQVQSTYSGTAAESMGLQKDDVILGINGQSISSMSDLRNEIGLTAVGDSVDVQVTRNGQVISLNSTVKPWPAQIPYEKLDAAGEKRFRDWQDKRQQRLADEVARLERDAEKLRQRLSGEDLGPARKRAPGSFDLAFVFHYEIDAGKLPAATAPHVELPPATTASLPPWRVSVGIGPHFTTL